MTVFEFELSGKFAHWKKFYTNSSSLTYYFPTRTNIIGIIASILEKDRDSYYGLFSKEKLDVAVALKSKVKKKITVVNYLNTKNNKGYTQIKLEILMPLNLRTERIKYSIYLRARSNQIKEELESLKELVNERKLGYGIYLGQRAFIGDLTFIGTYEEKSVNSAKEVSTVCLKENIKGSLDFNEDSFYVSDMIPTDFNDSREIKETKKVIANLNSNIKINDGVIENVYSLGNGVNISFL